MSQEGFVSNCEWKSLAAVFFTHLARTLGMFCGILNQTHFANSRIAFGQLFGFSGKCVFVQKVLKRIIQNTLRKGPVFSHMDWALKQHSKMSLHVGLAVQPVPWKIRFEMFVGMQIEILNGGEILVNSSKSRNSNFSVSRGTHSNWDFGRSDFLRISRYKFKSRFWFDLNLQLTKIFPPFRISICIPTSISSLIFQRAVLAKGITLRSTDFQRIVRPNTLKHRKSTLRSDILLAGPEVMHRPRSDSRLHFDMWNLQHSWGKIKCYRTAFACRSHARALAVFRVKITFELLLTILF